MKKCAPSSKAKDDITLEFPVDPAFVSRLAPVDPQVMLERVAEMMPFLKSRPGES